MTEIIQKWLGTRLGILLDISPQKFARNTKDGKILAELLFSYNVLPVHVFEKIKESKNYHECLKNLTLLKPCLEFIGVCQDDSILKSMAGGEGSAAITIFYEVFLNLERTDRFHYLSAEKERKFSEDSCRNKFKVDWVPEREVATPKSPQEDSIKLSMPLIEKRDMIDCHKAKCKEVVEIIKKTKENFENMVNQKTNHTKLKIPISKFTKSPSVGRRTEAEETREKIETFEKKHLQKCENLTYSELVIELKNAQEGQPSLPMPNLAEAKNIITNIRKRKKSEVYARNFQNKMQCMILDEQWKKLCDNQEKNFEESVYESLQKQSQYEKQMTSKLSMIRNQKKVLAENRKKIESLKLKQRDKEYDDLVVDRKGRREVDWEFEEFEKERIAELHRKIYDEKARKRKLMMKAESQKIYEALVDISVRMAEIRGLTTCEIPKAFMRDLKNQFFKGLSIFDLLDNLEEIYEKNVALFEEDGEGEEEEAGILYRNEEYERLKNEEADRQAVLDECDLNDYLNLSGPWMVELYFPDGTETEVNQFVLGCIVHKLLGVKYPSTKVLLPALIKPMKPTAIVQGVTEETYCKMLIDLMEACRILVVQVDEAINFVLAAYKAELAVVRDIDVSFQRATANALKDKILNGKENEVSKKVQYLKKIESPERPVFEFMNHLHKQTQTPRMIPEDDPLLSPNAELGKIAFEALGSGDPVPDRVIVSAVIAYVISKQDDYDGWVLLNYPNFYSQASELERALTGYQVLPILENMESLEDVEGFRYRELSADLIAKENLFSRGVSRLVPKPHEFETPPGTFKTYFDCFIKMKRILNSSQKQPQDSSELPPVDKFYSQQNILFNFEFTNFNFKSVKNLGKIILGKTTNINDGSSDVVPKTSVEIFGSVVLELNEKWGTAKNKTATADSVADVKKVEKEVIDLIPAETIGETIEDTKEETKSEIIKISVESHMAKPGDPDWEWATGNQAETIQTALASLWENMEVVYLEDFKNVFFCLRVHRWNVLSYSAFIKESARTLSRKSDARQKVLNDFQQMFNDIDGDLRNDVEVKCELHVRVSELEEVLMGISDERKRDFHIDLKKIGQDGWVSDAMANLVNIYLTALQLEADRCIDTCQIIMDYYLTLQQKVPDDKPLGKIIISKLEAADQKYSIVSCPSNKSSIFTPGNSDSKRVSKSLLELGSKSHLERPSKTRSLTDRRKKSSEVSFLVGASEIISDILVNLSLPNNSFTPFHNFFRDTVNLAANEVKNVVEGCLFEAKKGEKGWGKSTKKMSETKIHVNGNLIAEWTTTLNDELSRFLFRAKLILARGLFEMDEFLTTILNVLAGLAEEISTMYLKEIHSISECCKLFRCGIEEEIGIQPLLELKEDKFIVHEDVLLFPTEHEPINAIITEDEEKKLRFTIEQLALLCQKLQKVAPDGEIIKRTLVFILEDLRTMKTEIANNNCFPNIWEKFETNDLTNIVDVVYQDMEIVHWKDFIIYGMDLPIPTEDQILTMRKSYRELDPLVTELISREKYDNVRFWFETTLDHYPEVDRNEKAKDLLYRMYQVDEHQTNYSALLLAFCKDENPIYGFTKAIALAVGKKIFLKEIFEDFPYFGHEYEQSYEGMFDEEISQSKGSLNSPLEHRRKCLSKDKIVKCECKYFQKSPTTEEKVDYGCGEEEDFNLFEKGGEASEFDYGSKPAEIVTSVVNVSVLTSLLKASYPSLSQLSILLDCKQTFEETLNTIFDSLETHGGSVDVSKVIQNKFIHSLLQSTNKFKFIKIRQLLTSIIEFKNSTAQTACFPDKLNFNTCLFI